MNIPAGSFPHLVYYGGTTQCICCGLTVDLLDHKRCPAAGTAAYCDNQHPAWGKEEELMKLAYKTPAEWNRILRTGIIDYDGFDRETVDTKLISREEFEAGYPRCTVIPVPPNPAWKSSDPAAEWAKENPFSPVEKNGPDEAETGNVN